MRDKSYEEDDWIYEKNIICADGCADGVFFSAGNSRHGDNQDKPEENYGNGEGMFYD